MDSIVAFFQEVALSGTDLGARLARYPLVLVLGALALIVTSIWVAGYLAVLASRRRRTAWPWRTHFMALLIVLGSATVLSLDHRMAVVEGQVRRLEYEERVEVVVAAEPADVAGATTILDRAVLEPSLDEIFAEYDLHVARLAQGIDFATVRSIEPTPTVSYITVIDLTDPGVEIEITSELDGKTLTSAFALARGCDVAINGEAGVSPTIDAPLGHYQGNWVVNGEPVLLTDSDRRPFIAFDRENHAQYVRARVVDTMPGPDKYNVIWGRGDLLRGGEYVEETSARWARANPRTLMGVGDRGTLLVLMVVDGRQPGFSVGLDMHTAADVMRAFGARQAMWCDQGGSSTMVLGCLPGVVNQPSDGAERPVYTHFGIVSN